MFSILRVPSCIRTQGVRLQPHAEMHPLLNESEQQNYSSIAVSTHGYQKSTEFLHQLSSLPMDLIGVIHDFLNVQEEEAVKWKIAFQSGFLPKCEPHFEKYKQRIVRSLFQQSYGRKEISWDTLVRFSEKIRDARLDPHRISSFSSHVDMYYWESFVFENVDQSHVNKQMIKAKLKHLFDIIFPILGVSAVDIACGIAISKITQFYFYSDHSLFMRILAVWFDASFGMSIILSLCWLIIYLSTDLEVESQVQKKFLEHLSKKEIDLRCIEASEHQACSMRGEIARMIADVPSEHREKLNAFLSQFPFWKKDFQA